MSKKSNPTMIGAFVVGATLLIAAGIALFGGSELLAKKNVYVAYFEDRVTGLRVGANVLLQGVRIGYVSDIDLLVDVETFNTVTQVTIEIVPENYGLIRGGQPIGADLRAMISHEALIQEAGLRAQLEVDSYVTGQLLVELDLRPETVAVLRGIDPPYPEIPTISSDIQELLKRARTWVAEIQENVDFAELGQRLRSILAGLDELANSPDIRESLAGINRFVNADETQQLTASLEDTLDDLRGAVADASSLFQNADDDVGGLAADLRPVVERLNAALTQAEQTLAAAKIQLQGDTQQIHQLQSTLIQLERAARAVREFFDLLERNPEALVRGKK